MSPRDFQEPKIGAVTLSVEGGQRDVYGVHYLGVVQRGQQGTAWAQPAHVLRGVCAPRRKERGLSFSTAFTPALLILKGLGHAPNGFSCCLCFLLNFQVAPVLPTFLQEPLSSTGIFTSYDNSSLTKQFYNSRSREIGLLLFLASRVAKTAYTENSSCPFLTLRRVKIKIIIIISTWTGIAFCKQYRKLAILFQHLEITVPFHGLEK